MHKNKQSMIIAHKNTNYEFTKQITKNMELNSEKKNWKIVQTNLNKS